MKSSAVMFTSSSPQNLLYHLKNFKDFSFQIPSTSVTVFVMLLYGMNKAFGVFISLVVNVQERMQAGH
jgi:hypothetical protein